MILALKVVASGDILISENRCVSMLILVAPEIQVWIMCFQLVLKTYNVEILAHVQWGCDAGRWRRVLFIASLQLGRESPAPETVLFARQSEPLLSVITQCLQVFE